MVKKFVEFIKEANEGVPGATSTAPTTTQTTNTSTAPTQDPNTAAIQNSAGVYTKYKNRVMSMFNGATPETMPKISTDFENFINGLPEPEKAASAMLRSLFASEKMKIDIKSLEAQKQNIDAQLQQNMKDLKQIMDNLK